MHLHAAEVSSASRFPSLLVSALGVGQVVAWGSFMVPVLFVQAGAPLIAAGLWQWRGDYDLLEAALLATAALSAGSFVLAARSRPSRHNARPIVELQTSGAPLA